MYICMYAYVGIHLNQNLNCLFNKFYKFEIFKIIGKCSKIIIFSVLETFM